MSTFYFTIYLAGWGYYLHITAYKYENIVSKYNSTRLFRGHVPYQGGSSPPPPPAKKKYKV